MTRKLFKENTKIRHLWSDSSSDTDLSDFIVSDNGVECQDSEGDTDHLPSASTVFKCSTVFSKLPRVVINHSGNPCDDETIFYPAPSFPRALATESKSSAEDEIPDDLFTLSQDQCFFSP